MNHVTRLALYGVLLFVGCGKVASQKPDQDQTPQQSHRVLRLAVTTSTRDTGLLDKLVPRFENAHAIRVDVIAVGTGAAIRLGEAGDVDVILVHARKAEDAFLASGHGSRREDVMYNEFEILGPERDPAGIQGMEPSAALRQIAASRQTFVSRGDNSGTHQRELQLWGGAEQRPSWEEYVESGQGMGATLTMADQMNAYLLSDRGTYLKFRQRIQLVPLVTSSESLKNPYGIIVVGSKDNPSSVHPMADPFVDFMVSADAQRIIRDYRIEGEQLFFPMQRDAK